MVQFQYVVVFLGGVYRALVHVKYRLPFRFFVFVPYHSFPNALLGKSPKPTGRRKSLKTSSNAILRHQNQTQSS